MFSLCESMKWNHLPVQGGLYDQSPDLLDAFRYIFAKRSEYEEAEQKRRDQEMQKRTRKPGGSRIAGRR